MVYHRQKSSLLLISVCKIISFICFNSLPANGEFGRKICVTSLELVRPDILLGLNLIQAFDTLIPFLKEICKINGNLNKC